MLANWNREEIGKRKKIQVEEKKKIPRSLLFQGDDENEPSLREIKQQTSISTRVITRYDARGRSDLVAAKYRERESGATKRDRTINI